MIKRGSELQVGDIISNHLYVRGETCRILELGNWSGDNRPAKIEKVRLAGDACYVTEERAFIFDYWTYTVVPEVVIIGKSS